MKKLLNEFKKFIMRGNVIDLAVGVIIGSSFGKIVSSLVDNILMPLIGMILGGVNFSNLAIIVGESTINYGLFIQNIIDFLIIAFCIFIFIKIINKISPKKETKEETKLEQNTVLLTEIRDLLKNK